MFVRYSLSVTYLSCLTTLTPQFPHLLQLSTMVQQTTRVVYKPDPNSTDEFIAIVNPEEVRPFLTHDFARPNISYSIFVWQFKKWKEGGKQFINSLDFQMSDCRCLPVQTRKFCSDPLIIAPILTAMI